MVDGDRSSVRAHVSKSSEIFGSCFRFLLLKEVVCSCCRGGDGRGYINWGRDMRVNVKYARLAAIALDDIRGRTVTYLRSTASDSQPESSGERPSVPRSRRGKRSSDCALGSMAASDEWLLHGLA